MQESQIASLPSETVSGTSDEPHKVNEANFLAETLAKARALAAYRLKQSRDSDNEKQEDGDGPVKSLDSDCTTSIDDSMLPTVIGKKRAREDTNDKFISGQERELALKKLALEMRQNKITKIAINPAFVDPILSFVSHAQRDVAITGISISPTLQPKPEPLTISDTHNQTIMHRRYSVTPPLPLSSSLSHVSNVDDAYICAPDRIYAEEYPVEYAYVGLVIGKHGDNLKRIERESNSKMKFAIDPGEGASSRVVTITGNSKEISKAKEIIVDMISAAKAGLGETPQSWENNQNYITITVYIPNHRVGLVIGKGGDTIKELQNKSNCRISITPDSAADRRAEQRRVNIIGDEKSVYFAKELIDDIISSMREAHPGGETNMRSPHPNERMEVLMVPKESLGVIIGKNGETIKALLKQSRCDIYVQQTPDPGMNPDDRLIRITGTLEWIPYARKLIQEKVAIAMEKLRNYNDRNEGSGWYWKKSQSNGSNLRSLSPNASSAYNPIEPGIGRKENRYLHDYYDKMPSSPPHHSRYSSSVSGYYSTSYSRPQQSSYRDGPTSNGDMRDTHRYNRGPPPSHRYGTELPIPAEHDRMSSSSSAHVPSSYYFSSSHSKTYPGPYRAASPPSSSVSSHAHAHDSARYMYDYGPPSSEYGRERGRRPPSSSSLVYRDYDDLRHTEYRVRDGRRSMHEEIGNAPTGAVVSPSMLSGYSRRDSIPRSDFVKLQSSRSMGDGRVSDTFDSRRRPY